MDFVVAVVNSSRNILLCYSQEFSGKINICQKVSTNLSAQTLVPLK